MAAEDSKCSTSFYCCSTIYGEMYERFTSSLSKDDSRDLQSSRNAQSSWICPVGVSLISSLLPAKTYLWRPCTELRSSNNMRLILFCHLRQFLPVGNMDWCCDLLQQKLWRLYETIMKLDKSQAVCQEVLQNAEIFPSLSVFSSTFLFYLWVLRSLKLEGYLFRTELSW